MALIHRASCANGPSLLSHYVLLSTVIIDTHIITSLCLNVELQTLDGELDEKYKKVENLIAKKTEESADARRKAEMLQNEAKTLLAQANSKLQLLKGGSFHIGSCFHEEF